MVECAGRKFPSGRCKALSLVGVCTSVVWAAARSEVNGASDPVDDDELREVLGCSLVDSEDKGDGSGTVEPHEFIVVAAVDEPL